MPHGKEAKEEEVKLVQGKRIKVYGYGDDCVGGVHCNGIVVQVSKHWTGC